ncbi:hypothetical protein DFS33DRAFT_352957 [Desarmillaria ectypa]|nr:hypothetical protein DFS33DRAFT_352957 [Desarmillaria ectypa]
MLKKLDGLKDRKYPGYCMEVKKAIGKGPKFHAISIRPVQQGFTKLHPRKLHHVRPGWCIPISLETVHPSSREPLQHSKSLPWNNCYHPTCYDVYSRVPSEWRDYYQTPRMTSLLPVIDKCIAEDGRYSQLLHIGINDVDQIVRILDREEEGPDDASETWSIICKTFLVKIPGFEEPEEEDDIFMPLLRIDHILSNVPEISGPLELWKTVIFFEGIMQDYQLS